MSTVRDFLPPAAALHCEPLLPLIASQAAEADRSRTVAPAVIAAIRESPLIQLSAVRALGGVEATTRAMADELEAISPACASTAWCLWNHLCVFHYYCTLFGEQAPDALARIVAAREWVAYPNGAGTRVTGRFDGGKVLLDGKATFGSGARYGQWMLIMFRPEDDPAAGFHASLVRRDTPGVTVRETWDGSAVRASATDEVTFEAVAVPQELTRPWAFDDHVRVRDPGVKMLAERYREDWVGLGVQFLAAQATGLSAAALDDIATEAVTRRAIFGAKMAERPGVQFNLGEAAADLAAARAAWRAGCEETDARIAACRPPTEADFQRQLGYAMVALRLTWDAMQLMQRTMGGNGLREPSHFERRWRDFQAMPLHITAHPDRVRELNGRFLLGLDQAGGK